MRLFFVTLLWVACCFMVGMLLVGVAKAADGCVRYEPNPPHEPTGIKGCEVYGTGVASHWGGPGVARNDCVYPWTACTPIQITAHDTGRSLVVTPSMYCDCYTGTADQRIVDLDPAALAELGLDPAQGLFRVTVEPATITILPDTRMQP